MSFVYTLKSRKRTRKIKIAVYADGAVIVTKPTRMPKIFAEGFVKSRSNWVIEKIEELAKRPKKLLAHLDVADFKENKQKAYVLAHNRVLYFNQFYQFKIKNISIKNQKTRWGSCSSLGNLSFNYKIIFLPEELRDYIIVHELCHIKAMNHKKEFWDLVALKISDYRRIIKEIKLY